MTERQFQSLAVKHREAECSGKKGILCLMNFPIPQWARNQRARGDLSERLWDSFLENQYCVVFVPYFIKGEHAGEPNWSHELVRDACGTLENATKVYDSWRK